MIQKTNLFNCSLISSICKTNFSFSTDNIKNYCFTTSTNINRYIFCHIDINRVWS